MLEIIKKIVNRYHYSMESIKNRYPCKIIGVKNSFSLENDALFTYQSVTKLNIRKSTAKTILDDPMLLEKFHPTDAVKLGFIAFGSILLKENITIEESRERYKIIAHEMFKYLGD